jgi:hypothetical protein
MVTAAIPVEQAKTTRDKSFTNRLLGLTLYNPENIKRTIQLAATANIKGKYFSNFKSNSTGLMEVKNNEKRKKNAAKPAKISIKKSSGK